ncbi:hypothetical protein [Bradyrhizobium japonicum]|uniref:hypothetical protein n=1 Tax=Bradyrhizobium japonicum TaxID=375 RepID=UPI0012BC8509|nr:hypothetical protein [Bradyrhizobium japonicum]
MPEGDRSRLKAKAAVWDCHSGPTPTSPPLFPPEIYRFTALAEVAAAFERADLDLAAASDSTNEPVLLLAEKRRVQVAK